LHGKVLGDVRGVDKDVKGVEEFRQGRRSVRHVAASEGLAHQNIAELVEGAWDRIVNYERNKPTAYEREEGHREWAKPIAGTQERRTLRPERPGFDGADFSSHFFWQKP
jgi:hypothetical protein